MNKVAIYLNRQLEGNVFDKDSILEAYSTDRSVLKVKPKLVAVPESTNDIRKLCRFVNQLAVKDYRLPIAVRGSGLDTGGADLSTGIVVSTEKLNKIKEVDAHDRLVHVESGVTLGELNSTLASHGLILPINADPRETIGALISNCPTDSYASRFGGIRNYIDRIEVVLANGDVFQTSRFSKQGFNRKKSLTNTEGTIYRDLNKLLEKNQSTIEQVKNTRSQAGYPGIQYVSRNGGKVFDPLPVFYGAQGSLGIITEVILRTELIPPRPEHFLVTFNSFRLAHDFLSFAKKLHPLELNFYDAKIINSAEVHGKKSKIYPHIPAEGYLVYLTFCDKPRISKKKIEKCRDFLPKSAKIVTDSDKNTSFNAIFNSLASYLNDDVKGERTPFVSDFYVPVDEIPKFINDLKFIEDKYKISLAIYGSFATSTYSVRPDIQLSTDSGRKFIVDFLTDFNKLLKLHYGHISSGSPEGRLKALLTNHELTEAEKSLYREIKSTFDPNNILAPDVKLGADARSTSRHFRTTEIPMILS